MTGYGPPDDPSEAPTGYYESSGQGDPERGAPWYRKQVVLIALGLFVAILLGVAVYFLADQTHGTGGTTKTPTSPTMSTEVTTTTEPSQATTTTVSPTTTEPTTTASTTATPTTTTADEGHHHHHHHHDGGTP